MTVPKAYLQCRAIAKREARNFYYSFRVLPQHKSDAMCAVYAFMRRADDIADDESMPIEARRELMSTWLADWHTAQSGALTSDPVFIALRDTQQRFNISNQLLDQLVQGTTMDLYPNEFGSETTQTFANFDQLYRYCYLVASVVGLVCIRIFGYTDLHAEKLAEETGIAFQLTNILRDVKEDAERNRIYLPLDLLHDFGVTPDQLHALATGATLQQNHRAMLRTLAEKAENYYAAANQLLPLIDRDSRAALWVLVTIYHDLLRRINQADYDVFSNRASVPTASKLTTLARGATMALRNRMTS